MTEQVISDIWSELKRYINTVDRTEAAETVVQILMDNDCDAEEIKQAFKGDRDIKTALTSYLDNDNDYAEDEEPDEESDFDDDEHWEN